MSKIVYIIPGFGQNTDMPGYTDLIKFFKTKKFKVVPIKITWKNKVMSDYVNEFQNQLVHKKEDDIYLFGFSFGAIIAFISAEKIKPKTLFLASLSPYFKEDLKYNPLAWSKYLGKKRMKDFENFSFNQLSKKINCQTYLFVEGLKNKEILRRVKDAHKKIKKSELIIIENTKHDISQTEYLNKVKETINKITYINL
ncbi:MAG: hypothetical protein ACD_18C00282G0005 [uncultured bacterium]|nr:MAG: hypothetical protein ACD_18C00282G0005 [uncultured bacterium]OGH84357.1 MAG: hypothetical protein A2488_01190 [Candidatus Magasanikbacteria bacterium RIFOXYC12_FULL_32_21b]HAO52568.1 hypothetical protein [Candidatus Magasanikbacteria bacterium]